MRLLVQTRSTLLTVQPLLQLARASQPNHFAVASHQRAVASARRSASSSMSATTTGRPAASSEKVTTAEYGAWESPISSELLVQKNISFPELTSFYPDVPVEAGKRSDLLWAEARPSEKGRAAVIRASSENSATGDEPDLTLGKYNARCGVHEYGGGAIGTGSDGSILFTDYNPDRWDVYHLAKGSSFPRKISPDNKAHRFGGFSTHPQQPNLIVCILEDHTNDTPATVVNSLVLLDTATDEPITIPLVSGADFYTCPSFSPAGDKISWVQWDHPSMPWWSTQIHVAAFDPVARRVVGQSTILSKASGGSSQKDDGKEVMQQPGWMPTFGAEPSAESETLFFTSDRTGWIQLYSAKVSPKPDGTLAVTRPDLAIKEPVEAEMQYPSWMLSSRAYAYAFLSEDLIVIPLSKGGTDTLALIQPSSKHMLRVITSSLQTYHPICATSATSIATFAQSDNETGAIYSIDLSHAIAALRSGAETYTLQEKQLRTIKRVSEVVNDGVVGPKWLPQMEEIEFPSKLPDGSPTTSHAILFPPKNPHYRAPQGTSPPCRVVIHGGPTSAARGGMSLETTFWTSRGWLVCAVNYGGSTRYGREFMERMLGQWGVVDVEDCAAAAKYLGSSASARHSSSGSSSTAASKEGRKLYEAPTAKAQLEHFNSETQSDGSVTLTLLNHQRNWGWMDVLFGLGLAAATVVQPAFTVWHALSGMLGYIGLFKMHDVQQEVVRVTPGIGLQVETHRGLRLPWNDRPGRHYLSTASVNLVPRDQLVDLVVNDTLSGWGIESYVAAIRRESNKLVLLFPRLKPRLPLVQKIYQLVYPALFDDGGNSAGSGVVPRADAKRIVISGGSAGGYTVMAALCLQPLVFSGACSAYGISELTALVRESHKFESHYPLRLLGGSPEEVPDIYHDRSPLYMADRIRAPLLVLQGEEDKVVPPNQSEMIVDTIRKQPGGAERVKYVLFKGEGHGFRQAQNRKRAIEEELAWYEKIFHLK